MSPETSTGAPERPQWGDRQAAVDRDQRDREIAQDKMLAIDASRRWPKGTRRWRDHQIKVKHYDVGGRLIGVGTDRHAPKVTTFVEDRRRR